MEQLELLLDHKQQQEQSRTHTRETSSRKVVLMISPKPPPAADIQELKQLPWPGGRCSYKIVGAQVPDTIEHRGTWTPHSNFHVKGSLFLSSLSHCHVGVSDTCHWPKPNTAMHKWAHGEGCLCVGAGGRSRGKRGLTQDFRFTTSILFISFTEMQSQ